MSSNNLIFDLLSTSLVNIRQFLFTIQAHLNNIDTDIYMIKFSNDTQFMLPDQYYGFLKGLIFRKTPPPPLSPLSAPPLSSLPLSSPPLYLDFTTHPRSPFEILSVSYNVPIDCSYLPPDNPCFKELYENKYVNVYPEGTLIKLSYYNNKWNLSTNGMSDVYLKTKLPYTYGELFDRYFKNENYECLNHTYSYVFIINENQLYFVTAVNNLTLNEVKYEIPNIEKLPIVETSNVVLGFTTSYIMEKVVNENVSYTQRYLFPSKIIDNIIHSILNNDNMLKQQFPDKYNEYFNKIKNMYNVVCSKYHNHIVKRTNIPSHQKYIKNVLFDIHKVVYKGKLKSNGIVRLSDVEEYFTSTNNVRNIKYILYEIENEK